MSAKLLNVTHDSPDKVERKKEEDYKLSSNTSARFHRQAEVDEIKHGVWRDVFRRKEEKWGSGTPVKVMV